MITILLLEMVITSPVKSLQMSNLILEIGRGGGSRISGKGVHVYKDVAVHFTDFISFVLNNPLKCNNLVSLRPNYYI